MRRCLIAVKQRYRYVSFTPATSLVQGKCRNVIPSSQPQFLACTDDRIPDRTRCLRLVLGTYTLLPASTRTVPAHSAKVLASPQAHGTFRSSESSSYLLNRSYRTLRNLRCESSVNWSSCLYTQTRTVPGTGVVARIGRCLMSDLELGWCSVLSTCFCLSV